MKLMSDFKLAPGPDLADSHPVADQMGEIAPVLAAPAHRCPRRSWVYETLFARGRIDEGLRETLAWYDTIRSLSRFGPFRTNLPTMTSRGVRYAAIPAQDWQRQAQADLHWARGMIPTGLREVFDGLIDGTFQIDTIGRRWPEMNAIDARAHAEKKFLIAANFLLAYAGSRRGPSTPAA